MSPGWALASLLRRAPVLAASAARTLAELPAELGPALRFLRGHRRCRHTGPGDRLRMLARFYLTSLLVDCPHKQSEILEIAEAILALDPSTPGCVVEAGSYRGGSAAKLSVVCARAGRRLLVFDSFRGLPDNDEVSEGAEVLGSRTTGPERFAAGAYRGTRARVEETIARLGEPSVCALREGWFADTLPGLDGEVALAFLDVDLASSTRTCLEHILPRLAEGAVVFSHDGHLPRVRELLAAGEPWASLGLAPPAIEGLGARRLIRFGG